MKGVRITIAGLGRFGGNIAAARWLVEQGAKVLVTDTSSAERLGDSLKQLEGLPIELRLGEHRDSDFTSAELIVASPAIPPSNQYLEAARGAGVPVTTEIRLFVERCSATRIVGVTGTKGKSTTTAMIGEVLKRRHATWVGGNIGKSLLFDLPKIKSSDLVVLELSSFMLHYLREIRWSPQVAVVTLIATDHAEWHGGAEEYVEAKRTILKFQKSDDVAVVNEESPGAMNLAGEAHGRVIAYGVKNRKPFELQVPGRHNQVNAQGAFCVGEIFGCTWEDAQAALRDFKGLPHRLQLVHEDTRGVKYFNDSIATIPDAAIAALESFPAKRVIQIVGGSKKGQLPVTAMCGALVERAKAALCIGETGPEMAEAMGKSPSFVGSAAVYQCGDLPTALKMARQIAVRGDVVLLSPGAKSYDQFVNFEERGETFVRLVRDSR